MKAGFNVYLGPMIHSFSAVVKLAAPSCSAAARRRIVVSVPPRAAKSGARRIASRSSANSAVARRRYSAQKRSSRSWAVSSFGEASAPVAGGTLVRDFVPALSDVEEDESESNAVAFRSAEVRSFWPRSLAGSESDDSLDEDDDEDDDGASATGASD